MPYFRMRHTLAIDCIVRTETYEAAEDLSAGIRAVIEDEGGNPLPEDGNPLVSFEASSDAALPDITECDADGNPIKDEEEERAPLERHTT